MLESWINSRSVPKGIGVDCVCISRMRDMDRRLDGSFTAAAFTPAERELAKSSADPWCFLAGRFAVKEAVFKALSPDVPFDFRQVETLRREDGCPWVNMSSVPEQVLRRAGAERILVSITGEGDYAIALVQVS